MPNCTSRSPMPLRTWLLRLVSPSLLWSKRPVSCRLPMRLSSSGSLKVFERKSRLASLRIRCCTFRCHAGCCCQLAIQPSILMSISFSLVAISSSGMFTCSSVPLKLAISEIPLWKFLSAGSKLLRSEGVMMASLIAPENLRVPAMSPFLSKL